LRSRCLSARRAIVLAVGSVFAAAHPLLAGSDTYVGPPGGDWDTSLYWSPTGVPQPGDTVIFAPAGYASYTYDGDYESSTQLGALTIGSLTGSSPTFNQSSGTLDSGPVTLLGGNFNQSGGAFNPSFLFIATETGSAGTVNLTGGSLNAEYVDAGDGGAGTLLQSGTSNVNLTYLFVSGGVGSSGTASFSGGTLNAGQAIVGYVDGIGTLIQSGNSYITLQNLSIGSLDGTGTFLQSGASYMALGPGSLAIGNGTGSSGDASLSGGTLNTSGVVEVGVNGGAGTLLQNGTSNINLNSLFVGDGAGASGTASFAGGTLNAPSQVMYVGFVGGSGTLLQSGTSFINLPSGQLFVGLGGQGTVNLSSGTLNIDSGELVVGASAGAGILFQSGSSNLTVGTLIFGDEAGSSGTATISGGTLYAGQVCVGQNGTASVTQTAGAVSASGSFLLGANTGGAGTYSLSGSGSLSAPSVSADEYVGNAGAGTFIQTGGTNSTGILYVGYGTQSTGAYYLSSGTLDVSGYYTYESIGDFGTGTFIQTGGTHTTSELGVGWRGVGTYYLDAGTLIVTGSTFYPFEVIGSEGSGVGTFIQSGGIHTITAAASSGLQIGFGSQASGSYLLTAGTLDVNVPELIGVYGSGTFNQSGGINQINGTLTLAAFAGASGIYNLQAGTLTAIATNVGPGGGGATFTQSGSLSASSLGTLTVNASALTLSGGTMDINTVNSSGALSITGGTMAITNAGSLGTGTIAAAGLSITGPGVLDVGSSGIVIEYGSGTSPVGDLSFARTARNYPAGSIQRYTQTAFNGFAWNGPGISSSYAANDPNGLTAVGIADENDLDNVYPSDYTVAGGGTGTWMGQPINDTNNVLVRMTYYGDGNLDGVVNRLDVSALSQGYNGIAGYVGWSDGDYIYGGDITKIDVSLLAQSYLFQGAITSGQAQYLLALDPDMPANAQAAFQSIAGTPEPATIGLLAISTAGLMARRRERVPRP